MNHPIVQALSTFKSNSNRSLGNKKKSAGKTQQDFPFYVQQKLSIDTINITVQSVGELTFPLENTQLAQLKALSKPAKFGRKEKTLLDKTVRNTNEIEASMLTIEYNEPIWNTLLKEIHTSFGLPSKSTLSAHLHNLLVYEPGQFFKAHQDSEKLPGMVATLVIVLPCSHIGGAMFVKHQKKYHTFQTENLHSVDCDTVAFYADCEHEVLPVKEGHRLVLTYNLVVESEEIKPAPEESLPLLEHAIEEFFSEIDDAKSQNFLYIFDHSYSQKGLNWHTLKGNDIHIAQLFLNTAAKLDLNIYLTQLEVHQSWDGEDGDRSGEGHSYLICQDIDFKYWVDKGNQPVNFKNIYIEDSRVIARLNLADSLPDEQSTEGWMGNYGNTSEYWYQRAGIVVWPNRNNLVMEFSLQPESVKNRLLVFTQDPTQLNVVKDAIVLLGKDLYNWPKTEDVRLLFALSCYVADVELANQLLSNITLDLFNSGNHQDLLNLENVFGDKWVSSWILDENRISNKFANSHIISDFTALVLPMISQNSQIVLALLQSQLTAFKNLWRGHSIQMNTAVIEQKAPATVSAIQQILHISLLIEATKESTRLLNFLSENSLYFSPFLILRALSELAMETSELLSKRPAALQPLLISLKQTTSEELNKGLRDQSDYSIKVDLFCDCNDCNTIQMFLKDSIQQEMEYPMAQARRDHLIDKLKHSLAPVKLRVSEVGRPYRLIVRKKDTLYEEAQQRFEKIKLYNTLLDCWLEE